MKKLDYSDLREGCLKLKGQELRGRGFGSKKKLDWSDSFICFSPLIYIWDFRKKLHWITLILFQAIDFNGIIQNFIWIIKLSSFIYNYNCFIFMLFSYFIIKIYLLFFVTWCIEFFKFFLQLSYIRYIFFR